MELNDEDDLFGSVDTDGDAGGDAGGAQQEVALEAPKDEGNSEGAEGNPQEGPVEGEGQAADGEPKPEKVEGEPKVEEKETKLVPKAALDSEKRRRRELAARLSKLEEREAERERAAAAASAPRPGDPGYEEFRQTQTHALALNQNLNRSEYDVRKAHGDEKVEEMMAWAADRFNQDPEWAKKVFAHAHPYDFAMTAFDEHVANQEKPNDHGDPNYAAFLEWQKGQAAAGGGDNAPPAAPPGSAHNNAPGAPVPISIGQRPSAGGPSAPQTGNKDAFDQEFG